MKKLLLISLILGASVTASANSKFQNQFKQVEQMTDSCGEANYGDSLTCYNEVIAKHAQLAETIKGHSPEKSKITAWNKAVSDLSSINNLCNQIGQIQTGMQGAASLGTGDYCRAKIMGLTSYKAAQIFGSK
ncbi:hypothetical protein NYZ65_15130 [Acinetobacter baumannii]|nr:hypothetical protein [Acinetobacter baumannii]